MVGVIAAVASTFAVLAGLAWLAGRARRGGTAGAAIAGALAAYDEAMHSTAHDAYQEMQADADRITPAPSPDGEKPGRSA